MGESSIKRVRDVLESNPLYFICALALVGIGARLPLLDAATLDTDVFVIPWFDRLASSGHVALGGLMPDRHGETGGNYSPPYYYLLYLATLFDGLAPRLWLTKFISIAFDFIASALAFALVRQHFSRRRAMLAAAAVLLAPTVLANGAWWGQCDMIWVSLILGSLYFTMVRKPLAAMIAFAIGFSFKAQAIFFAPFLFTLFLRGELGVRHLAAAPLVYAGLMLPAVALGHSWLDVLTIYLRQGGYFGYLSMHAPNLYYFAPPSLYAVGLVLGSTITLFVCAALAYLPRWTGAALDPKARMLAATMFVALSPFLLPKMHDRYFFAADIFSIMLAMFVPRLWPVPVLFQVSSLAAYVPIISLSLTGNKIQLTLPMAAMINTVVVTYLVYEYCRACTRSRAELGLAARQFVIAAATIMIANAAWLIWAAAWDALAERLCPAQGPLSVAICETDMPGNLLHGRWGHWLLFLFFLVPSYGLARFALSRLWSEKREGLLLARPLV
jgi:Gpi18-like mannosyltransferase